MRVPHLVSVIIPTFNRAVFLSEAIRSVQNQSYPNIQIIVIDDGSTDETKKVVESFQGVEYYYQENKRQGAARNLGFSKVKGEYFASLDSDDIWDKTFVENSVKCLEENKLDFVFTDWLYRENNVERESGWKRSKVWEKYQKSPINNWFILENEEVRQLFIETCPAPSSSMLINRKSINHNWCEELLIADDWCFILELVLNKKCRAAFSLNPRWTKRIHQKNIYDGKDLFETSQTLGFHDEILMSKMFEHKFTEFEKNVFRKRLSEHYFNYALLGMKRNQVNENTIKSLLNSFSTHPSKFINLGVNSLKLRLVNLTKKNNSVIPAGKTLIKDESIHL